MDEVLASLQRGQIQLRKVSHPRMAPPAADPRSDLMSAIRQGVTLKKVSSHPNKTEHLQTSVSFNIERDRDHLKRASLYIKTFDTCRIEI